MGKAADQDLSTKFVGAVGNAVAILRHLAQSGTPGGVAAIARNTGISVSSCFNILRTLASERLVDFNEIDKTYRIGMGMLEFSIPLLGVNQADLIRPRLVQLAQGRSCLICLWNITADERMQLADRVTSELSVRVEMALGSRLPAYVGAVGRCYAANSGLGEAELETRFAPLRWQSPPDFGAYLADVRAAARDGYALDMGQLFKGLEIAGALVTDAKGGARYGLSGIAIVGQMQTAEIDFLASELRDTADWISETLFGAPAGKRQAARRGAPMGGAAALDAAV